ncbi:MAG: hypothetical protein JW809_12900 [Pirellulales bacterium]|nr:hypothetical protein [Pirellulales bacterium]
MTLGVVLLASACRAQGPPVGPALGPPMAQPASLAPSGPAAYSPAPYPSPPEALAPAAGAAPARPEETVVEVRIVGNRTVKNAEILPHIRTRAGRPFRMELIEQDVRRLDTTRMFVTIKPSFQEAPGGRIVIFEVVERPTLRYVKFVGNQKIKEKTLLKESHLAVGDAADPFAVEEARRSLEMFYRDRGFGVARVTVHEGNKLGDQGAVFIIHEGPKQRILWTDFVGNTIADDARLRTQIESKQGVFWVFKGEFDRKKIEEDKKRIEAYYRGLGFFRARVGVEIAPGESQNWVRLTFVIDEGPRYKLRDVYFAGNTKFSTQVLGGELELQSGEFFNQNEMDADVRGIQERYGSVGYIFTDVQAQPRLLEEPGLLDLVYQIEEGDRYRVGRINPVITEEFPHTKISTVLTRISLQPGDIVDIRELRDSERRLRACGLFEVNPQMGAQPKIVFSPNEAEDPEPLEGETPRLAQPPRPPELFRGQSPDSPRPLFSMESLFRPSTRPVWFAPQNGGRR